MDLSAIGKGSRKRLDGALRALPFCKATGCVPYLSAKQRAVTSTETLALHIAHAPSVLHKLTSAVVSPFLVLHASLLTGGVCRDMLPCPC